MGKLGVLNWTELHLDGGRLILHGLDAVWGFAGDVVKICGMRATAYSSFVRSMRDRIRSKEDACIMGIA